MPPRKAVGNPEYVEILEAQKAKIASEDPTSNQQYTYGKAIKSLKDCSTHQAYPGEIKVKYVGPTILAFLKAELAKGRHQRPVEGYDSLVSSSGSSSDPLSAADIVQPQPRLTAKQKGKGKARHSGPGIDFGLQAIAGKFGDGYAARQQEQDEAPKQTSAQGLCKAAAIEEAILVGLYTQCHEMSQKIWKSEKELLTLAEPWMTFPTKVLGARLLALATRNHLEAHVRGNDLPVYSFTLEGYGVAQRAASLKGLPAIEIVQNDLIAPEVHAPEPTRTAETVTVPIALKANHVPGRPKGLVSVHRGAPIPGNFATIIPRKRTAPAVEDTYQGLSQYTRIVAVDAAESPGAATTTHKPVNKRFAAPTIASVFHDQPAAAPAAHADILPFLFAYVDENDNRISTRDDADVKLAEDGTSMHKVEYRTRQARHLLAKLVQDRMPMNRTPPDSGGPTECGWMAANKAPAKCPGLASSKATSNVGESGAVSVKKASKSSTIASLMAGTTQHKKTDTRAMYKFPSIDAHDFGSSSSPDKPRMFHDQSETSVTAPVESSKAPFKTARASNAELISTIFGDDSARSTKPSASIAVSPTTAPSHQPIRSTVPLPRAAARYIPAAPVASASNSSARPAAPPHTPPAIEGYTRSYSWALEDHVTFPSFDPVVLPAGTYHIVMQIDHRELLSVRPGTVENFFTRKGINFQLVNLVLGDYLWVARRKILKGDGYDEIVLAICERKRKDDFVDSIKDERHVNQKRRINATGVRRCFYLVEDYDIGQDDRGDVFTKAIQTSINQTLLIDQFSLHIAATHAETMAHLTRITRALEDEAKTQTVRVIPDSGVSRGEIAALQRYLERKEPEKIYYTSSKIFTNIAQMSVTTKSLWARQVRHVCGMSEEQCVDFLGVYPTPISFFEDLDYRQACEVEADEQAIQAPLVKEPKKWKASDPRLHVKNRVDAKDEDRPRAMCRTVSARLWHLVMADDYTSILV